MTDIKVGDRVIRDGEVWVVAAADLVRLERPWADSAGQDLGHHEKFVAASSVTPIPDTVTPTLLREDADEFVKRYGTWEEADALGRIIAAFKEAL